MASRQGKIPERASFQDGMETLLQLRAQFGGSELANANEAATRLLIIDRILEKVLGWPKETFNPESPARDGQKTEWIDYHLECGGLARLVVEAKRKGRSFTLPHSKTKRARQVSMKTARSYGKNLRDALLQARDYCEATGTQNLVVTNGSQWIAGVLFVPHVRRDDLRCVVFDGFDDIIDNLQEFYQYLSVEGMRNQSLRIAAISNSNAQPAFAESLNQRVSYNPVRERNYLSRPLEALSRAALDTLPSDDIDMVRRCYVSNELTDGYVGRLELFVGKTLPDSMKGARHVDEASRGKHSSRWAAEAADVGELMLLVGKVGSGKTSFLTRALTDLWGAGGESTPAVLHLDLLHSTHLASSLFNHDELKTELCEKLLEQAELKYPEVGPYLYEVLTGVFSSEIQREVNASPPHARGDGEFSAAIAERVLPDLKSRPTKLLYRYLTYLRQNRRRTTLVIFDNVDQGTEEFERFVVQFARSLVQESKAAAICAIRDTTFERGRRGGFLDVSQNSVFYITAPPFASVFSRRIAYVREEIDKPTSTLRRRVMRACEDYPIERVVDFADVIGELVLGKNKDIERTIQALAGTNARLALELVREFLTSQNTDIEQLLKRYNDDYYKVPLDLFLRAVMRGSRSRYVESKSRILNVFQVRVNHRDSHFDAARVLQLLDYNARTPRVETDTAITEILETIGAVGHSVERIRLVIRILAEGGLIQSRSHPEQPWPDEAVVRISGAGKFYLTELIYMSEYLESIVDDLIVYQPNTASDLYDIHNDKNRTWPERLSNKVRVLVQYLRSEETRELSGVSPPPWLTRITGKFKRRA